MFLVSENEADPFMSYGYGDKKLKLCFFNAPKCRFDLMKNSYLFI